MSYHLTSHIYITQFRDELIVLDLKKDKYTVCIKEYANLLLSLLERSNTASMDMTVENTKLENTLSKEKWPSVKNSFLSSSQDQFPLIDLPTIQDLLNDNIIEEKDTPYPFHIDRKFNSGGVSNVEWLLPLESKKVKLNVEVLKALIALLKVNFYTKVRGFYSTIQLIKKSCNRQLTYTIPSDEELKDLAGIVNKACLLYPTRTKCLEWAMTFVLLALKRKWKCNLEIGIQNYPFFAHAWVECDGKVVMDSQDLREGLAIILNEPFRRLRP